MGIITQVNYISDGGFPVMQLSGYFLENEVNKMLCYPKGDTNISNAPTWDSKTGSSESVALDFFNSFKTIQVGDNSFDLGITAEASQGRGTQTERFRDGEYLGTQLYKILEPDGLSYRVLYNFQTNEKRLEVWGGLDRTQENPEGNNPIIFSVAYKNIVSPNVLIDETDYKAVCINVNEQTNGDTSTFTVIASFNDDAEETDGSTYLKSSLNINDYTQQEFYAAMVMEGLAELENHKKTINIEFDAMAGSYEYGVDFNLGDLCSVEIADMGLTADVRLIGCYEVMKNGEWSMNMEFGTPILKK